ncbi:MAG: hypothetical protein AAF628_33135 [Planctomycetota bacterium]
MTDRTDTEPQSFLDQLRISAPCPASWDQMAGDDRTRFCDQCQLNVYNLGGMTREEGEALVRNAEGRLCVRLVRREDGTVMTQECPVGLRRRLVRGAVRAAALCGVLFGTLLGCGRKRASGGDAGPSGSAPMQAPSLPAPPTTHDPMIEMGDVEPVMGIMGEVMVDPDPAPANADAGAPPQPTQCEDPHVLMGRVAPALPRSDEPRQDETHR